MLEVIGAGDPDYHGQDWADMWASSPESKQLQADIENIVSSRQSIRNEKIHDDREYAMPLWTQITKVTERSFVSYWRSRDYIMVSDLNAQGLSPLKIYSTTGQDDASYLYRAVQHIHFLASRKQLY